MKSIVKTEDLYKKKEDFHDDSDRHSILHVEIQKAVNLACRVQVEEEKSVVVVIVDELLEEER